MAIDPTTIAVIGASTDRRKYGNIAVRAFHDKGFTVYPVNLHEQIIEGLFCFASIQEIPGPVEIATLYIPPEDSALILDEIAGKGIKLIFFNPGAESEETVARAKELGMEPVQGCSLIAAGTSPAEYL